MMEDRSTGRGLPDSFPRVMDFKGGRDLVDPGSDRTGVLSAVHRIHHRSVTRGRDGASYADSQDIAGQHAPEMSRPEVETTVRAHQQIRHAYEKSSIGEMSNIILQLKRYQSW